MVVVASSPVHRHKDKCFRGPHKGLMAATQVAEILSHGKVANPGAGLEPEQKPFEKVFKDGYFEAACVKDYMWDKGDKFGNNAGTYDVENSMNVSIVHYKAHVSPPEPITPKICFDFCRTIPDMKFFGLIHGRDCYCSPFFKQDPGDSSGCDAVCEGDGTQMCGGMAKSGIFAMHLCANTAEEISDAISKAEELAKAAAGVSEEALNTASDLQDAATELMNKFGKAGDPVASNLMKDAIVVAGQFEKKAKKTKKLGEKLDGLKSEAEGFDGKDFTDFETVTKAEKTIAGIDKTSEELEQSLEVTISMFGTVIGETIALEYEVKGEELEMKVDEEDVEEEKKEDPEEEKKEPPNPLKLFLPVMHFVDQEASDFPSTCGGDVLNKPLSVSAEDCAMECQGEGNKCSGFSFFAGKTGVCVLFEKMKSVQYYTKCGGELLQVHAASSSFLQMSSTPKSKGTNATNVTKAPSPFALALNKRAKLKKGSAFKKEGPEDTMCYAKYSMHSGTTLKPDPSGKCKNCLKTVDKAQRCFE